MKKDFLDSVTVESPCHERWEEMTGSEQVRFCSHCSKDVHNLSSMSRTDAERLVKNSNGRLCVRYIKTPQGKLITAPPVFTQIRRQSRIAAGVFAASLALSMPAYSQQTEPVKPKQNWTQTVKKISKTGETSKDFSTMSGTVTDEFGAVISEAMVTLRDINDRIIRQTLTDANGIYEFVRVEPNVYKLEIERTGFKKLSIEDIKVAENEGFEQTAVLEVAEATTGLLVIEGDPVEPGEAEINQTVQKQEIVDLPKNPRTFTTGLIAIAPREEKPKEEKTKKTKKNKN